MSPTSASVTSSNHARPVAVPLRPRSSRTRSDAAVATNVVSTRVQSRVPPTAGAWLVNGKEAIETVAGTAVGYRARGSADTPRVFTQAERR